MYVEPLNTDQFQSRAREIDTVVIPVGSLEAHGQHCPLGTDNIIPRRLCEDLEKRMSGRIWIAPPVLYGYTPALASFPGTVTLSAETLISLYTELATGFVKWGAKNVVFMNGHGGNIPMLTIACDRIAAAGAAALAISWWLTYSREILTVCQGQGHAGEDETALILAIDERLVDRSKIRPHLKRAFAVPLSAPGQLAACYPNATSGDGTRATAAQGERLYALMLERNVALIERLRQGQYTDDIA